MNKSKYNLVLCELHFPPIHGKNESSSPDIETHYLLYAKYDPHTEKKIDNEYEPDILNNDTELNQDKLFIKRTLKKQSAMSEYLGSHPCIRNYYKICENVKPEIGECITLPTLETIVILKTFWFRIICRKWKKIMEERRNILTKRQHPESIKFREIHGFWSENCRIMPSINGMFSDLKM
jgi:hypothetical protein